MVETRWSLGSKAGLVALLVSLTLPPAVGCGGSNELEILGTSVLRMREFDRRDFALRYTDRTGYPIQQAKIKCDVAGSQAGANIEPAKIAVTDQNGVARMQLVVTHESAFKVPCQAVEDGAKAGLQVVVSNANGGQLEVVLHPIAKATVETADVIVAQDMPCAAFNPILPPAPAPNLPEPMQTATLQGVNGVNVAFIGLEPGVSYTVVAIGKANNQVVAAGCQDRGLTLTEQAIEENKNLIINLDLTDAKFDISANTLTVTTEFTHTPLMLNSLAGLFKRMSDGNNDPADYLLSEMAAKGEGMVAQVLSAFRPTLAQILSRGGEAGRNQNALKAVASQLERTAGIKLHTTLEIMDESIIDGMPMGQLVATHTFKKFSANINGQNKDFTLPRSGRTIYDNPMPIISEATNIPIEFDQANRVTIGAHTLSLPLADAVLGTVLFENFGDYRVSQIIKAMVRCDQLAQEVDGWVSNNIGSIGNMFGSSWISSLLNIGQNAAIRIPVLNLCRETMANLVNQVFAQLQQDLAYSRADQEILLEGSAAVQLASDSSTILMVKGQWDGVGSFSGTRQ